MTGPKEPGDDWGFPEVDPASPALPPPADEVEDLTEPSSEPSYDTGSDAWWRAQQEAQRQAAAAEAVVPPAAEPPAEPPPPPPLVEPTVLNQPSPLDATWVPPEVSEPRPAEDEPVAEQGEPDEPAYEEPAYEEAPVDAVAAQRVGPARALAGAALALVGVALAIGALFVFNGKDEPKGGPALALPSTSPTRAVTATTAPTPSVSPRQVPPVVVATSAPATTTPAAPAQAPVVPVSVLNNSRIKGLAERASARFRAGGWPVATTGNYRGGNIAQTTVYYAPGQQASAQRFARQFGIPRVAPRFPGIPVQGMTVILTRDYRA